MNSITEEFIKKYPDPFPRIPQSVKVSPLLEEMVSRFAGVVREVERQVESALEPVSA